MAVRYFLSKNGGIYVCAPEDEKFEQTTIQRFKQAEILDDVMAASMSELACVAAIKYETTVRRIILSTTILKV